MLPRHWSILQIVSHIIISTIYPTGGFRFHSWPVIRYIFYQPLSFFLMTFRPQILSGTLHEKHCCVTNCHNTPETVLPDGHKIMLHRLPAESKTRNVWLSRLHTIRKHLPVNDSTRVCSAHFENYDKGNYLTIFHSKPAKYRPLPNRKTPDVLATTTAVDNDVDFNVTTYDSVSSVCPTSRQNVYVKTQTSFSASAAPDIILEDLSDIWLRYFFVYFM